MPVVRTGRAGSFQVSFQESRHRVADRKALISDDRPDAMLFQVMGGAGTHPATDDRVTVTQQGQQTGMAVLDVLFTVPRDAGVAMARALSVVGFRTRGVSMVARANVRPDLFFRNSSVGYREHDETRAALEVFREFLAVS